MTGHNEQGQAVVLQDSMAPNTFCPPMREGVQVNNVCRHFGGIPEVGLRNEEACEYGGKIPLLPPDEGGAVFRVIEFSPEGPWIDKVLCISFIVLSFTINILFKVKRSTSNWLPLTGIDRDMRHPLMHRSETIDYGVVVSGEIVLMLDNEEVELKAGDVFVQRGTNHAWSNRSNIPCRIAFVLVTAKFEDELKKKM